MKKLYIPLSGLLLMTSVGWSQISVTTLSTAYTEDFNTLASSGSSGSVLPAGFSFLRASGSSATYSVGTGSTNAGGAYSFGSTGSSERAFGSVGSTSTGTVRWGFTYTNNTAYPITSLEVGYTGEQWRDGGSGAGQQQLTVAYTTGASPVLGSGSYTAVNALGFNSPYNSGTAGALDGNAAANRTVFSPVTITLAAPLAVGSSILLRWEDIDHTSGDHALAIDDVSVTFFSTSAPLPVTYLDFAATYADGQVAVSWATATERDNAGFEVERSTDAVSFAGIGRVAGKGLSSSRQAYAFTDETPAPGWNYYRLKQSDTDGTVAYSRPKAVLNDGQLSATTLRLFPNPATGEVTLQLNGNAPMRAVRVTNAQGQLLTLPGTNNRLNVGLLPVGLYIVEVQTEDGRNLRQRFVKE
jgi:hypothetical protein